MFVRPFPDLNGGKWKVSTGEGGMQRWSWDGQELFYWTNDGKMMAVAVETNPAFKPGMPKELFQITPVYSSSMGLTGISWDIHPASKRFLMLKSFAAAEEECTIEGFRKFNFVLNWFEELKQRVPVQ
jgi:hypothetical protein